MKTSFTFKSFKKSIFLTTCFLISSVLQTQAGNRYWVASSTGNWNDINNWSGSSGGGGGSSVPGINDWAIFDGGGSKNGNCTIDASPNVAHFFIQGSYSGTVTQGAGISITSGGWTQSSGTFTGSAATITITGTGGFTLSGGTFTSTTGIFYHEGNWTHTSGGTFNHNNGTITFNYTLVNQTFDVNTSETFYNFNIEKGTTKSLLMASGDNLLVLGTLNFTSGGTYDNGSPATIEARGNVTVGSNFINGNGTALLFSGTANQTFDLTGATNLFDAHITVNKSSGKVSLASALVLNFTNQNLTITSGTFDVAGYNLTAPGSGGTFSVGSCGIFQFQGGESISSPTLNTGSTVSYNGTSSSYTLKNYSYKNLTINGGVSSVFSLPANLTGMTTVTISQGILSLSGYNLSATTLSNEGTLRLNGHETITLTTTDVNSGTFEYVGRNVVENLTIKDFGSTDYFSLKINDVNANKATYVLGAGLNVDGILTLTSANISVGIYNLTLAGSGALSGGSSSSFVYTGSTGQFKWLNCAASTSKTFPVGHTNSSAGYTPLVITFNSGHTTDDFGVVAYDLITNDGTRTGTAYTSTVVKTTWNISETVSGGSNVNIQFQWNGTDEGTSFARSSCHMSHYSGSAWENPGASGSASGSNPYTFTFSDYTGTFSPFGMGGSGGPLPVKLLYFKANKENKFGQLNWATASEINNDYFNLEKSLDGDIFQSIGKIYGDGNSQQIIKYSFTDSNLAQGLNYYRLKQTDYDGKFSYSHTEVVIHTPEQNKNVTYYPIPASDHINIDIASVGNLETHIRIINILGTIVLQNNIQLQSGHNHIEIDLNELQGGVYFIQLDELNTFNSTRFLLNR